MDAVPSDAAGADIIIVEIEKVVGESIIDIESIMGIPISMAVLQGGRPTYRVIQGRDFSVSVGLSGDGSNYHFLRIEVQDVRTRALISATYGQIRELNPVVVSVKTDGCVAGDSYLIIAFACNDTQGANPSREMQAYRIDMIS